MKPVAIKKQVKRRETYQEEVRTVPRRDRPHIKLRSVKGRGPEGTLTERQIDTLIKAYSMNNIIWLENTNERLWQTVKFQRMKLLQYQESIEALVLNFDEAQEDLTKKYYEAVRAYNGLLHFNKLAEDLGVNIKEHQAKLPENKFNNDYTMEIGQEVLESGKIRSKLKLTPKPHLREKIKKENERRKSTEEEKTKK